VERQRSPAKRARPVEYDSDIDPDDLLPVYLECKTQLFQLQQTDFKKGASRLSGRNNPPASHKRTATPDPKLAKALRKISRIEDDVLFDKYIADQQWEARRIQLEKDAAARRNVAALSVENSPAPSPLSETADDSDDEVSKEAARIGAAMLEEDSSNDDAALADLFASLPVNEVDPVTGKSTTVVNSNNGVKVTIRDFGKWMGVSPTRVLEEACRAR
jgi:ATP-dependent RNA helicase DHX29